MKYIIDVPDNTKWLEYYQPGSSSNICFHGTAVGINELKPYTEPDCKAIEDEVWEFARKLSCMKYEETRDCFGIGYEDEYDVLNAFTYSEAKARYEAWKKQKDEFHIGDELLNRHGVPYIIYKSGEDRAYGINFDEFPVRMEVFPTKNYTPHKTGRTFPEIAELLKKMKEE